MGPAWLTCSYFIIYSQDECAFGSVRVCACVCERVKCQTAASNLAPPVQQPVAPPHGATGGRLGSSNRAAEGSSCFSCKRIETFSRSLNKTTCSHQRGWKFLKRDHPFLNSFLLSLQMTGNSPKAIKFSLSIQQLPNP